MLRNTRNKEIYEKFNGFNYRRLAEEFNLSEKTIREIIAEYIKEQRDERQLKLF